MLCRLPARVCPHAEADLAEAAGGGVTDEIAEDGESSPKGKGLEGKDDFHVGCVCDVLDKLQVATKQ